MLSFDIGLRLPWNWFKDFKSDLHWYRGGACAWWPNKAWEVQIGWFSPATAFDLTIDTRMRGEDHAGLRFELTVFGLMFSAQMNDTRHWNDAENRWQTAEETAAKALAGNGWEPTKAFTREELRAAVFDALEKATVSGDRLDLQEGRIGYDGEFSLDGFVDALMEMKA